MSNEIKNRAEPARKPDEAEREQFADLQTNKLRGSFATHDPLRPRTESQRVHEAEDAGFVAQEVPTAHDGLLRHQEQGHLVGVEQAPLPGLAVSATIDGGRGDRRMRVSAEEAANRIRGEFVPAEMPAENVRHELFLTMVARNLGADPNPPNLEQIAKLLGAAGMTLPDHEYPKMLYSRQHPTPSGAHGGTYDARHDHVSMIVHDEDQATALGEGWFDDPAELPPRGDIPLYPPAAKRVKETV